MDPSRTIAVTGASGVLGGRVAARLDEAGVAHELHSGVSIYFRDPDGARLELIADPLGEMYGEHVL